MIYQSYIIHIHKGCSAWRFGYEILRYAQYDTVWGTKPPSLGHAERSAAQSKHLYMLVSHLGLYILNHLIQSLHLKGAAL